MLKIILVSTFDKENAINAAGRRKIFGFKGVFVVFAVACFACRVYTFRGVVYIVKT